MLKNVLASAEDMGLILGLRTKTPHAVRRLSVCATTVEPGAANTEPCALELLLCNKRSPLSEKPEHHNPQSLGLEKAQAQPQRSSAAKNNNILEVKK